jgi:DNA-binding NtrC family response regulator
MLEATKKNILVIDDNLTTLAELRIMLEGSFEVYVAKDAKLAQSILHKAPIDVILLDLEMPGMSGLDFLNAIHNNTSFYFLPIIIVSSHGTEDSIKKAKKNGASGFIVKPCNPKSLIDKINSVLKTARKKISKEVLARKLNIIETACATGQGARIIELVNELEQVYCDIAIDLELAEIYKEAVSGNYKKTADRITALIKDL